LTRFLEPFGELKAVDKRLRYGILAFLSYLFFSLLAELPITLYFLIEYQDFYNLEGFSTFHNFLLMIAVIAIYLTLKNNRNLPLEMKELVFFRSVFSIFILYYVLNFYVFSAAIEFRPINVKSLPSKIEYFIPFDWSTIQYKFTDMIDGSYFQYSDYMELAFAVMSAVSIILAIIFVGLFWKSSVGVASFKFDLSSIAGEFKNSKTKIVVVSLIIPFLIFGNARIQAEDFYSMTNNVEFIQDDLIEFQKKLPRDTDQLSPSETIERRKLAAQSVYNDLIQKERWVNNDRISLWSPDVKELRTEVIEWIALWEGVLKEISLNGYTEKESIFELQQKYEEISSFALNRAPRFTQSYVIDFWRDEFVSLLR
jgi:hypothetical protein